MTRQQISAWAHVCDWCGEIAPDLALTPAALPDDDDMRSRGWNVIETGDTLCPACTRHRALSGKDDRWNQPTTTV